jgi:hypothetical protein
MSIGRMKKGTGLQRKLGKFLARRYSQVLVNNQKRKSKVPAIPSIVHADFARAA